MTDLLTAGFSGAWFAVRLHDCPRDKSNHKAWQIAVVLSRLIDRALSLTHAALAIFCSVGVEKQCATIRGKASETARVRVALHYRGRLRVLAVSKRWGVKNT
jgi:hypothetical protein